MNQGFKEWALICEALGQGRQSIILRKGGIAEGRARFHFAHAEFMLFPTLFHEQVQRLKLPPETALPTRLPDNQIEIRYVAHAEWTLEITDPELLSALTPFHLWRDEIIAERFAYEERAALSLAFVRVSKLAQSFVFPDSPKYGGCRSWVTLPELPAEAPRAAVLSEAEHRRREDELRTVLSSSPTAPGRL